MATLTRARRLIRETERRAGRWYKIVFLEEEDQVG